MNVPNNLKYTKDHEWIRIENEFGIIGITDYAQHELGDIVFVEVDSVGEKMEIEETFGTIEAVKTVSDMFMPVSGEIMDFNEILVSSPETINKDPYGDGWVIKIHISNIAELDNLMDADAYKAHIGL